MREDTHTEQSQDSSTILHYSYRQSYDRQQTFHVMAKSTARFPYDIAE